MLAIKMSKSWLVIELLGREPKKKSFPKSQRMENACT